MYFLFLCSLPASGASLFCRLLPGRSTKYLAWPGWLPARSPDAPFPDLPGSCPVEFCPDQARPHSKPPWAPIPCPSRPYSAQAATPDSPVQTASGNPVLESHLVRSLLLDAPLDRAECRPSRRGKPNQPWPRRAAVTRREWTIRAPPLRQSAGSVDSLAPN